MTLESELKIVRDATMERMPVAIIKTFKDSINSIRINKLKENALQVGDKIPNTQSLIDNNNNVINLNDLLQDEFLILNFYRGGWCPYCNMELRAYNRLKNDFLSVGANIVAISSEVPKLATQTTLKNTISYPILTDANAQFMKALGIVFKLDDASKREFVNFGIDFTKINGNDNYELPVPAIYVINKNKDIVYTHFEADYMTRLEPETLLTYLKTNKI
ncbi:peroxiredoxin-like family protein [uncultured Lacinutrix sp.]|uniref:peroxiredoxin-like family protein n=1 Tax=uncultured Lacinutrix sp. TaxID=574032 RepID=UPI00260175E0|nr:peroxiredoxin-like family protein [uncultured Lacinutrix sp.]